jgi:hypothetical protein
VNNRDLATPASADAAFAFERRECWNLLIHAWRPLTRGVADVGNMNFVRRNRIENEITETRCDDDPRVWFVGFPPFKRVIG